MAPIAQFRSGPTVEDDLLARVAHGDRAAFTRLYTLTVPRVLAVIRSVLIDPAQSEEVAHEVFLELWQCAPRFDLSKGHATSLLLTMAKRRAIDRVRLAQASRIRDLTVGIRDLEAPRDIVSETTSISVEFSRAQRAMASISEIQRQAVELISLQGFTSSEVAERLGVGVSTIKTRHRDGLIALRRQLETAA